MMITNIQRIGLMFVIALGIMLVIPTISEAAVTIEKPIPVYFNDETIEFNIDPVSSQGTTLVEFRPIFEKLGLQISWDQASKTIGGYKEGLTVELQIGSLIAKVNGVEHQLQIAPMVVNERTVVPLRFVGEAAGSYVQWDQVDRIIHLYRISPIQLSTTTNYLIVEGRTPNDIQWLRFNIVKEGLTEIATVYVQPEDGYVYTELYLPDGAGVYKIEVSQTKLGYKETSRYVHNTNLTLVNYGNSGLHLDTDVTDHSQIRLYGELLEEDNTIVLFIENEATKVSKQVFLAPVNLVIDEDIFLDLGEGSYIIDIYRTVEPITNNEFTQLYLMESYSAMNKDTRDMDLVPSEMVESEHPEIVALAKQITEGLNSDQEKSLKIHDWVTGNINYDAATILAGNDRIDTALEVLRGRLTDCDGYARLNIALHRAAGIRARIIVGSVIDLESGETWTDELLEVPNHAWNEVFINGRWIIQDPTWNAGYVGSDNLFTRDLNHDYYDPVPEVFARDHHAFTDLEFKYE